MKKLTALWAGLAIMAFASNSIFCRLALRTQSIDALSFTGLRLAFGALTLALLMRFASYKEYGSWPGSLALAAYAILFSLAYREMGAATGALLLFGSVQLSLLMMSWRNAEPFNLAQKIGYTLALLGMIYLLLPGFQSPKPIPALLMFLSGISWAFYTLLGRRSNHPLRDTYANFMRLLPFSLLSLVFAYVSEEQTLTSAGVGWSFLSGAIASGLGYAIWYKILPQLTAWKAGLLQLLSPPLAGFAAWAFLAERLTLQWYLGSLCIVSGLCLAMARKKSLAASQDKV